MRLIKLLILFSFFLFPHADDMYLLKGGNVFLPNVGFVKKDILVDEGLIISIEDEIDSSVSENVINSDGKYITPGLIVFSALGLIEIGALLPISLPKIFPPIKDNGLPTLPIGLSFRELSPVKMKCFPS